MRNNENKRSAKLDICRLVGALIVMAHHTWLFGNEDYPFAVGWIYVEFFLIITGYFTVKHFWGFQADISVGKKCKVALEYVFHKIRRLWFFAFVSVAMVYILDWIYARPQGKGEILSFLESWICEAFFWGIGGIGQTLSYQTVWGYNLAPLWYLSSVIVVLPIVCLLLLGIKSKKIFVYFSWMIPVFYYTYMGGVHVYRIWPHDIVRTLVGISLGAFVFIICTELQKIKLKIIAKIFVTIIEISAFIFAIVLCYYSVDNTFLILFLFILLLVCILSEVGLMQIKSNKFTLFIGDKLSMVMFLAHWPVFRFIQYRNVDWMIGRKTLFGYLGTLLASCILIWLECKIEKCIPSILKLLGNKGESIPDVR